MIEGNSHEGKNQEPENHAGGAHYKRSTRRQASDAAQSLALINNQIGAFLKQHRAHHEQNKGDSSKQGKWSKGGVVATALAAFFAAGAFGATSYQAWIARDTERRQLRAYVAVDPTTKPVLIPDKLAYGSVIFHNSGTTPARNISFFGSVKIVSPNDIWAPEDLNVYRLAAPLGAIFPSKDRNGKFGTSVNVSQDDIDDVNDGDKVILLFGTVFYKDALVHQERYTNYCYYYTNTDIGDQEYVFCSKHNDAH